jgi:uncharacterized membrane protein
MAEHVETPQEEHVVYEFFLWSVLAKGAISVVEVISGIALFFIPPDRVVLLAVILLNYLPVPAVQSILLGEVAKYTAGAVVFVALYLLSRGGIKVFLIWSLLKNRIWAYPASLVVLLLFVFYQIYQIVTDHSLMVLLVTVFDLVVMYFIYREWRIVARHRTGG